MQYSISPKVMELNDQKIYDKIDWIKERIPEGESELFIAIGGDGEALKAFHKYPEKKILGFKIEDGRSLGFYSAVDLYYIDEFIIEKIKNENFQTLSLPLLEYIIHNKKSFIINELCVQRSLIGKSGKFLVDGINMHRPFKKSIKNKSWKV
ncbi:MAG: hypothetical protein ACFFAS_02305 [Promethearchaeota archaeon]